MSLQSWKNEFYSIPADQCPVDEAINHSIRKWTGLRAENIARHGLRFSQSLLQVDESSKSRLDIDSSSCALCHHYMRNPEGDYNNCSACPLYQARNNTSCDKRMPGESFSPYLIGTVQDNPEPMLQWLEVAKAFVVTNVAVSAPVR